MANKMAEQAYFNYVTAKLNKLVDNVEAADAKLRNSKERPIPKSLYQFYDEQKLVFDRAMERYKNVENGDWDNFLLLALIDGDKKEVSLLLKLVEVNKLDLSYALVYADAEMLDMVLERVSQQKNFSDLLNSLAKEIVTYENLSDSKDKMDVIRKWEIEEMQPYI